MGKKKKRALQHLVDPHDLPMRPDKLHRHEAIDRTHVVAEMFDYYVLDGEFVSSEPRLKLRAEKISAELHDLYQRISRRDLDIEFPEPKPKKKAKK